MDTNGVLGACVGGLILVVGLQAWYTQHWIDRERARHDEQARQWHKDYLRLASLIKAATVQEAAVDEEDALQFVPRNDGYGT